MDDDKKAFIQHFIKTYESHDLEAFWKFYAEDCKFTVLTRFGITPSWEHFKVFMAAFLTAFPDVHHDIKMMVTEGENVWVHYHVTGTHKGTLRGIMPTQRHVAYSIVAMYRIINKTIVEVDLVADNLLMLQQLGVVQR